MKQDFALWKALNSVRYISVGCRSLVGRLRPACGKIDSRWSRVRNANPLLYLFAKTWHYSKGNQANVVLFWLLFIVAEISELIFPPLIVARMMNVVQKDGITRESIVTLFLLLT